MRKLSLLLVAAIMLAGCAPQPTRSAKENYVLSGECAGIEVVVNFGMLGKRSSSCVEAEGPMNAKEALALAGFETEGTATYGDQIVCRVNGLPSATEPLEIKGQEPHLETCENMPPSFAYWALWLKPSAAGEWDYATEGVGTLLVDPGQVIGLAFSVDGATPTPN